jgi:hypothetical protein
MIGNNEGYPPPNYEQIERSLYMAEGLIEGLGKESEAEPTKIKVTSDGKINSQQLAELMNEQKTLNFADAKQGDVIWWQDKKGRYGYFAITKPYKNDEENFSYGKGILKVDLGDKSIKTSSGEKAWIFPEDHSRGFILKRNNRIKLFVSEGSLIIPSSYITEPVKRMGIVRKDLVKG